MTTEDTAPEQDTAVVRIAFGVVTAARTAAESARGDRVGQAASAGLP